MQHLRRFQRYFWLLQPERRLDLNINCRIFELFSRIETVFFMTLELTLKTDFLIFWPINLRLIVASDPTNEFLSRNSFLSLDKRICWERLLVVQRARCGRRTLSQLATAPERQTRTAVAVVARPPSRTRVARTPARRSPIGAVIPIMILYQ